MKSEKLINKRSIFALYLVLVASVAYPQHRSIDNLVHVIANDKDDTNKVKDILTLLNEYNNAGKNAQIPELIKEALDLSAKLHYIRGEARANDFAGLYNYQNAQYSTAIDYYAKSLDGFTTLNDKAGEATEYTNLSSAYDNLGNYPKALENNFKAMELYEAAKDTSNFANITGIIGLVYWHSGDYAKAIDYDKKALHLYEETGSKTGVAQMTNNLGIIYNENGDQPTALIYYKKALEIYADLDDKGNIATVTGNIGFIYEDQGDFENALKSFETSLHIHTELGNKSYVATETSNIGLVYYDEKNYKKAEEYFQKSLVLADSLQDINLQKIDNEFLSQVYVFLNQWQKAYKYYRDFTDNKDSLTGQEKSKQLGEIEAKADFDKKFALEKAEDERKTELANAESRRQKIMSLFVAAIAIAVALIAIIIFRALRITRKQKTLIEEQKVIVEQQKGLVEEKNKEVLDSITYAKRLQDAILPPLSIIKKYLPESFVLYKPKDIVAGDFYWMEYVPSQSFQSRRGGESNKTVSLREDVSEGGIVLIAAADCTGHGVPGALVSVVCSNALNSAVKEFKITEPGKILDKVRELVLETFEKSEGDIKDGMDISLCCINTQTHEIEWSGAYNPLWYVKDDTVHELEPDKQPIGKHDFPVPFNTHSLKLHKGDILYLFTDGYADQFGGPKGKKFKYQQLNDKIKEVSNKPMEEQKKELEKVFDEWKGSLEQIDDVLLIGIRL